VAAKAIRTAPGRSTTQSENRIGELVPRLLGVSSRMVSEA
jgi:hypothetical protein